MLSDQRAIHFHFERDGYTIVKGLYSALEMDEWKRRIVKLGEKSGLLKDSSGVEVWMAEDLDLFFKDKLTDHRIAAILQDIIGPDIEFLSVKPVLKNHSIDFGSPWHHDWAYWKGSHKVSIWIALDKATRDNGCLKMIPGSHKIKMEMNRSPDSQSFKNRIDEKSVKDFPVTTVEADSGDVIIFHDLTLHASFPNTNGIDRWSFIATYRDASIQDNSTKWASSLLIPGKKE